MYFESALVLAMQSEKVHRWDKRVGLKSHSRTLDPVIKWQSFVIENRVKGLFQKKKKLYMPHQKSTLFYLPSHLDFLIALDLPLPLPPDFQGKSPPSHLDFQNIL